MTSSDTKVDFGATKDHGYQWVVKQISTYTYLIKCSLKKDKSGADQIIVKKQPYQLLNINREFFPSFDTSNFHKLVNESS